MNGIEVKEATEHCNCNACGSINYESSLSPKMFRRVDRLLSVSVGGMTITLCPSCALKLVQLIEPEISEPV